MEKNYFNSVKRILVLGLFACFFMGISAQVTFLDSSVVTDEALYFWKADDAKPYHYGRTINPHGNCIKVYNGYVFFTWYRGGWSDRTLMLSRKKIGSDSWKHIELRWDGMSSGTDSNDKTEVQGQLSLVGGKGDTHLTTNIGICPLDSSVHIMYDHHNEELNYIRSKKGVAFGSDEEFSKSGFYPQQNYLIPGKKVTGVSYPNLFNNDNGEMFFERRLGSAVGGEIVITYYDGNTWSPEKTIINGRGGVTQGERNFCYGSPFSANGSMYYTYSPRWAESPTTLGEGVYIMDVGPKMDKTATNVDGKSYPLPITEHSPFFIADPRSVPTTAGWAGGPSAAISPKGDIYLRITPKNTPSYNYLRKAGETEFTESRDQGSLGKFYGNRMYKFVESGGYLYVKSCLAGTYDWRTDYSLKIGINSDKSRIIMQDGYIAAVYREQVNSPSVPIHCFVFKVEKSEYTPQTITMSAIPEKTEGDADFTLSASASSNLALTYTSSNTSIARIIDGNKVKIVGVGTCDIIASQAGNGEFDAAPEVKKALIVKANTAKQNQTIQFSLGISNYVWESGDIALSATATSTLPVTFESADTAVAVIRDGKIVVKRAGTTTINALQVGNATYNAAPIVGYELNVPKRTQVITFTQLPDFTSGDKNYTIVASSNNPNATLRYVCPSNQVAIVWDKYVRECLAAGSSTITVSAEGDEYYTAAEAKQTITVNAKTHQIPAQIEAEYCTKKSGVDVTRWSNSVFYLNSWGTNDYAEYTINVPKDGVYQVDINAASPATGKKLKLMVGATTLATATLTKTPNLTNFKSTKVNVNLKAGVQTLKVVGVVGGYNFDWMKITSNDGGTVDPGTGGGDGGTTVPDYVTKKDYSISSSDGEQAPNVGTNLYDGKIDDDNRWSVNGFPKSITIDLGEEKEIIGTRVWTYQSRAYQYTIGISNSATDGFAQVVDRTSNTSKSLPLSNDFSLQKGRYVKLTVTGCHDYSSTWVSINELALIFEGGTASTETLEENRRSVSLYPNPTSSSFRINMNGINEAQVQIYNMSGKVVYNDMVSDKSITLESGMYLVKVTDQDQKTYCEKLIIK